MKQQVLTPARERRRFYLGYTILFGIFCLLVFMPFLIYDKSFVWANDGLSQHFNAFVYLGDYLRGILKTLFTEGRLVIPMWEFGIGYGADIITTLQYYVLGDPVAIFSTVPVGGLSAPSAGKWTVDGTRPWRPPLRMFFARSPFSRQYAIPISPAP